MGGLLLVVGLVMLGVFTFLVDLPSGLGFLASFVLGVVPAVVGAAILWGDWRTSAKSKSPEAKRQAEIKDQIVWRALAQGGRITSAEAAAQAGLEPLEVEHALLSLVSEGRAEVEAGESGDIIYRIDSPVARPKDA